MHKPIRFLPVVFLLLAVAIKSQAFLLGPETLKDLTIDKMETTRQGYNEILSLGGSSAARWDEAEKTSWLAAPLYQLLAERAESQNPTPEELEALVDLQKNSLQQGDMKLALLLDSYLPSALRIKAERKKAYLKRRLLELETLNKKLVNEVQILQDCLNRSDEKCSSDGVVREAARTFRARNSLETQSDLRYFACLTSSELKRDILDQSLDEALSDRFEWLSVRVQSRGGPSLEAEEPLLAKLRVKGKEGEEGEPLFEACKALAPEMLRHPDLKDARQLRCFGTEFPFSKEIWLANKSFYRLAFEAEKKRVMSELKTDLKKVLATSEGLLKGSTWSQAAGARLLQVAEGMANCLDETQPKDQISKLVQGTLSSIGRGPERLPIWVESSLAKSEELAHPKVGVTPRDTAFSEAIAKELSDFIRRKIKAIGSIKLSETHCLAFVDSDQVLGKFQKAILAPLSPEKAKALLVDFRLMTLDEIGKAPADFIFTRAEGFYRKAIEYGMVKYLSEKVVRPEITREIMAGANRMLNLIRLQNPIGLEVVPPKLEWKDSAHSAEIQDATWTIRFPGPGGSIKEVVGHLNPDSDFALVD